MRKSILVGISMVLLGVGDSRAQVCLGDCDNNGAVAVNELMLGVNIALGRAELSACPAINDGSGLVTISVMIRAVRNALDGCPIVPTATATATESDATATATATESDDTPTPTATESDATATATATESDATATATATESDATATATESDATATATATESAATATATATESDATATATESDETPTPTATESDATATATESDLTPTATATESEATPTETVSDATATATAADETPTPTATESDDSPTPTAIQSATATVTETAVATATETSQPTVTEMPATPTATPAGSVSNEIQAFVGSVVSSLASLGNIDMPDGGGAGSIGPININCSGGGMRTISCGPGEESGVVFQVTYSNCQESQSFIDGEQMIESSGDCTGDLLPLGSPATITFTGTVDNSDPLTGIFAGTIAAEIVVIPMEGGGVELEVSGTVISDCVGGTVVFETTETIVFAAEAACPSAGRIELMAGEMSHVVQYSPEGVLIDGETFESCEAVATCAE